MAAIVMNSVSKSFEDLKAVDQLSLSVGFGEIYALLGTNGAGKTTSLNMISGLLLPDKGEVLIDSNPYDGMSKVIRNKIGYLTSEMGLYENLSVRESLYFFGNVRGMSREQVDLRIEELEPFLKVKSFVDKRFPKLSSGQKQRSLVAMTFLHDPKILFLDEITASIDIVSSRMIMDFLKREKERGKAILFSSHILSEAEYIADRIGIIAEGKLLTEGTSSELCQRYDSDNLSDAFFSAVKESVNEEL